MGGYDDGTFRPDNPVLRAQYAKMITIALAIHDAPWTGWNSPHFSDVPRPAAQDESMRYPFDFVEEAAIGGLVKGYSDGQFRQWQPISRSQLALMIARAGSVDLQPAGAAAKAAFNDLTGLSQETRDAIALCYENGIILGKTPGMFALYAPRGLRGVDDLAVHEGTRHGRVTGCPGRNIKALRNGTHRSPLKRALVSLSARPAGFPGSAIGAGRCGYRNRRSSRTS